MKYRIDTNKHTKLHKPFPFFRLELILFASLMEANTNWIHKKRKHLLPLKMLKGRQKLISHAKSAQAQIYIKFKRDILYILYRVNENDEGDLINYLLPLLRTFIAHTCSSSKESLISAWLLTIKHWTEKKRARNVVKNIVCCGIEQERLRWGEHCKF